VDLCAIHRRQVYSLCSGRRAEPDIKAAVDRGHLSRVWDPNTLFRVMEDPALTPILVRLIMESSAPLAGIERLAGGQYAQDSTGFPTCSTSGGSIRSTGSSARSTGG
jgi:hypothetical protein